MGRHTIRFGDLTPKLSVLELDSLPFLIMFLQLHSLPDSSERERWQNTPTSCTVEGSLFSTSAGASACNVRLYTSRTSPKGPSLAKAPP